MKLAICFLILLHRSQCLVYGPVVRIPQGELRGIIEDSIIGPQYVAFKGIPYGKPPVGALRFRDPVPAGPWTSRLNASKFGPICAQMDLLTNLYTGSDDCLYLNVYAPSHFNPSRLRPKPVMFWIHGGGFIQGSGDDVFHGPDYIVTRDVMLVTINYRLGPLGFLNLDNELAPGNQGLKDQILALKWVQRNIAYFGGNPKSVTIFGESAGAGSVHYLTLSPAADGLYHKAIAQSGVVLNSWATLPYSQRIHSEALVAQLGNSTKDTTQMIEFLRTIDAQRIARADIELMEKDGVPGLFHFVPSADNASKNPLFPVPVKTAVHSGVKVPFLLGYVSYEGMLFLTGIDDEKWKSIDAHIESILSPGALNILREKGITLKRLREIYFCNKNISQATRANYVQMQSDLHFIYGIHDVVAIQASKGHCSTYLYEFSFDGGFSIAKDAYKIDLPGPAHSDEVPYILYPKVLKQWKVELAKPGSKTRLVIDRMTQLWTDFAKTGNPTPAVTNLVPLIWKPVDNTENFDYLNIGEDLRMATIRNVKSRYTEKPKCNN